jgi:pimeloyl-ACP methyl ester carboxylesterase
MVDPDIAKLNLENTNMDLHYEIQEQGEPVVFLHGSGADLRKWQNKFLSE